MPYGNRGVIFWEGLLITSCSYEPINDTEGVYLFGIPIKRFKQNQVTPDDNQPYWYLHFSYDYVGLQHYKNNLELKNLESESRLIFSPEDVIIRFNQPIDFEQGISISPFVDFHADEEEIVNWQVSQIFLQKNENIGFTAIWEQYTAYGQDMPCCGKMNFLEKMIIPIFAIQINLSK